jgi:hypothetical protein
MVGRRWVNPSRQLGKSRPKVWPWSETPPDLAAVMHDTWHASNVPRDRMNSMLVGEFSDNRIFGGNYMPKHEWGGNGSCEIMTAPLCFAAKSGQCADIRPAYCFYVTEELHSILARCTIRPRGVSSECGRKMVRKAEVTARRGSVWQCLVLGCNGTRVLLHRPRGCGDCSAAPTLGGTPRSKKEGM